MSDKNFRGRNYFVGQNLLSDQIPSSDKILRETLHDEYTFVPVNNPANTKRGGVDLFYKISLPVVIRIDLSLEESIVAELKFGRIFFLLFCSEVLPLIITLLIFKPFYQILLIYMQKSKQKILLRHFLQEILMPIPSFGGLMVIQLLRALKSNFFCLH